MTLTSDDQDTFAKIVDAKRDEIDPCVSQNMISVRVLTASGFRLKFPRVVRLRVDYYGFRWYYYG